MNGQGFKRRWKVSKGYRENNFMTAKTLQRKPAKLSQPITFEQFQELQHEAELRIKRVLGPDGMFEALGLDAENFRNLDPVVLATVAANLVSKEYSRQGDRQAIVRAALLIGQARNMLKNGLSIFDVPEAAQTKLMFFWSYPAKSKLDKINHITDPQKRYRERVKFITRQTRLGRAETDFSEMLGEWAREQKLRDIPAYKKKYRELLSSPHVDFLPIVGLRDCFTEWRAKSKSEKNAAAGKKSQERRDSEKQ
jgi:hypothetical protein